MDFFKFLLPQQTNGNDWKPGKWPSNFIPDKMIYSGEFYNDNGHLPQSDESYGQMTA